jgi:hypothetical protein
MLSKNLIFKCKINFNFIYFRKFELSFYKKGRYEFLEKLESGSMGTVLIVRDKLDEKRYYV